MGIVCSKTIKVRYGSHPADVRLSAVGLDPHPADVPCRAVGLDLQSRPIEYKDFQSARQQCTDPK